MTSDELTRAKAERWANRQVPPVGPYSPPAFASPAFNCPHCFAYSKQCWSEVTGMFPSIYSVDAEEGVHKFPSIELSICEQCTRFAVWVYGAMVYPATSSVELPAEDMPSNVRNDYMEARAVF